MVNSAPHGAGGRRRAGSPPRSMNSCVRTPSSFASWLARCSMNTSQPRTTRSYSRTLASISRRMRPGERHGTLCSATRCSTPTVISVPSAGLLPSSMERAPLSRPSTFACPLHHKGLDLGVIGLSDDSRVLISSRLHGGETIESFFGRYHRQPLRGPVHGYPPVRQQYVEWHTQQVFKDPPRP